MTEYVIGNLFLVGIVTALVEMFKRTGLPDRFAGLASVIVGIVVSLVFPDGTLAITIFEGVVIGLVASGFYSSGKALYRG